MAVTTGPARVRLFLVVCSIILSASLKGGVAVTNSGDVAALSKLFQAWSNPAYLNWVGDPCDNFWTGITCNPTNTSVIILELEGSNLQGTLPPDIGGLTELTALELSRNPGLNGVLPKELGQLINLQYLSLQWCNFSGSVPSELGNLVQLTLLGLNGNQLGGSIPSSLGQLKKLTWLDISVNLLTGTIPVSSSPDSNGIGIDNMTSLRHFHFNDNKLGGSIPPELFSLPSLLHVIVDHNELGSTIPTEVENAKVLTIMRLDNNQLSGNIPAELGNIQTLVNLNLDHNGFTELPDLSNLTNLQLLDVSSNPFLAASMPSWLLGLNSLQTLSLADSNVVGQILAEIFNLPSIQSLNLSSNQLNETLEFVPNTGPLLKVIDLRNNSITGYNGEPDKPGIEILLDGNQLCSNKFLTSVGCSAVTVINSWVRASNTSCNGVSCRSEDVLNPKTCLCANAFRFTLTLTGPTFSNLTDSITDDIEVQLATNLDRVLSNWAYSVDYYPSALQVVIASGRLTSDRRYMLDLQFFPVTGDSLDPRVRSAIVNIFNQRRFNITYGPFEVAYQAPYGNTGREGGGSEVGTAAVVGIVVGLGVIALILTIYAVKQKRKADRAAKINHPFASWGAGADGDVGDAPQLKGSRWVSLAELKIATDNWSIKNEMADERYGKVYKGILTTGQIVVIKRARGGTILDAAEFRDEIETLSRVHHRNLVGLVGFCFEGGEQALVYEFTTGGKSLRDYLHGKTILDTRLNWQDRLEIALGSARGIAYLHDHANPSIIHGDIKSSNILVNDRGVAKVADFGLSNLTPGDDKSRGYTQNLESTGYLDPEYLKTSRLTAMSDVYSFGVVLFELLTAKDPVIGGKFVVHDFRQALNKGGVTEVRPLLDPRLDMISNDELEAFLKIAFVCVEESSADRQKMAYTVKDLESLEARSSDPKSLRAEFDGEQEPRTFNNNEELLKLKRKQTSDDSFQHRREFGSSIFRNSFSLVTSRLQSPRDRPFSPLRQTSDFFEGL